MSNVRDGARVFMPGSLLIQIAEFSTPSKEFVALQLRILSGMLKLKRLNYL
jgi:hypothetical protein